MVSSVLIGLGVLLVGFGGYVMTRESQFRYERSGVIKASPEEIFLYISDLKKGEEWSPYEKIDPNMKKTFEGPSSGVGAVMEWEGNSQAGSGRIEILKVVPNEFVELRLTMRKPIHAENLVQYKLTSESQGTVFSWSMSGNNGFFGKLLNVFIDCEEMVAGQFSTGINNLKQLMEPGNVDSL